MKLHIPRTTILLANVLLIAVLLLPWLSPSPAQAQGNLLTNPNFEEGHGNGVELVAPPGWGIWAANAPHTQDWQNLTPVAEFTSDPRFVGEGYGSFHAYKGWSTFNVSIYQTVGGITPGSTVRLTASGRMWSCQEDAGEEPCLTGAATRNESNTGANFRVGIDPNGANDPNSGSIVWSGGAAPYTGYQQMTVETVTSGGSVTVVLNASVQWPAAHQDLFWDGASLAVVAAAGSQPPADTQQTTTTTTSQTTTETTSTTTGETPPSGLAASVSPSPPREDGSIVHVVSTGDTLAAIAVAYGLRVQDILSLNGMPEGTSLIVPGQELIIRPADASSAGASTAETTAADTSTTDTSPAEASTTVTTSATTAAGCTDDDRALLNTRAVEWQTRILSAVDQYAIQPFTGLASLHAAQSWWWQDVYPSLLCDADMARQATLYGRVIDELTMYYLYQNLGSSYAPIAEGHLAAFLELANMVGFATDNWNAG